MPKSNGFNLYALKVYYKDGTTNICYARKTDDWFYFSDAMDFRIKLGADNTTITEQEWRRKHYSSSWYESGLLDHVMLMEFGEEYLQSELNPMRDEINANHGDIINNYNTFVQYQQDMWNVIGNNSSQQEFTESQRILFNYITTALYVTSVYNATSIALIYENFNKLIDLLIQRFQKCLVYEDEPLLFPSKTIEYQEMDAIDINLDGTVSTDSYKIPLVNTDEGTTKISTAAYQSYQQIINELNNLTDTVATLNTKINNQVLPLESRVNNLESRVAALEQKI